MRFDVLTLFPAIVESLREYGVVGRALERCLLELNTVQIRDFSRDRHHKVDDIAYGGGAGMVMTPQPIHDALKSVQAPESKVIYLSPQGKPLTQKLVLELAQESHLILLCGHYEGIDSRIVNQYVDLEISLGDYVVTGGEIPAMILLDAVSRFIPGVLGNEESARTDSHYNGLLQWDIFTRPRSYEGIEVPEVLFSGNHKKIEQWRLDSALENTKKKRPDLYEAFCRSRIERSR